MRYETRSIGTSTVQGPAEDMPRPFDPQAHNADRAQIAALGADHVPAARRSPLEHERDAGPVLDPASEVAWLRKIGIKSAADLIEALVEECSREFGRGYEVGRAVGALEGPRPMAEAEAAELLGVKREGGA